MGGNTRKWSGMSPLDRLLANVEKTSACWIWRGSAGPNGYGRITIARREWLAHRLAYALLVGPLDPSLEIDHLCRNRGCVNPQHLEQVTRRTNIIRSSGFAAKNARATHCPRGHPYTPENTYRRKTGRQCRTCALAWRERLHNKLRARGSERR